MDELLDTWDWRTHNINQGRGCSCWSLSAVAAMELGGGWSYALRTGTQESFSEQALMDCVLRRCGYLQSWWVDEECVSRDPRALGGKNEREQDLVYTAESG
ncbi:hypothetical protein PsorP6_015104 [Peronosclerospora sorghi]|uniref:Uncharacterized protein n=1 Tax=Peronosclerospora sorghi TaxID=230839 RepID=A0ACC0VUT7_9STRA|nr:hypothetical protein PsorP6_015104 [Peronosclerospora sorghi]